MAKEDIRHGAEIFVEPLDQFVGRHALGERREAAYVGEHDAEFFLVAAGTDVALGVFVDERDHARREILSERLADLAFLALFKHRPETDDSGVSGDQRARGNDEAVPASPGGEGVVNKSGKSGEG